MAEPTKPAAPRLTALALKQPTIALTVLYLLTAVVGMTIAFFKYQGYGLLIFEWWEPSDYFLAAFREPGTLGLSAGAAIITSSVWWAVRRVFGQPAPLPTDVATSRVRRWLNSNRLSARINNLSPQARMLGVVAYAIFFFVVTASSGAFLFYEGQPPKIRVHFTDGRELPANTADGCYLLGTSNQYLFVGTTARRYVHGGKVSVLPVNNVTSLEFLDPPKD